LNTWSRPPSFADLARSVVFRWYAQPVLRRNRARVYAGVRKHLSYLDAHPDAPDRTERIAAMVASAEPLVRLLGQRIGREGAGLAPLLEVLTRRYYGIRALRQLHASEVAGCTFVIAEHEPSRSAGTGPSAGTGLPADTALPAGPGPSAVLATAVDFPALPEAVRVIGELCPAGDDGTSVVADIYLTWADQPHDPDVMAAELRAVLAARQLPSQLGRITVTVAGPSGAAMHHHFTFRPTAVGVAGVTEERLIRGLHPLIAQRMQLERLRDFDLTRLPSADEEVYLFSCVARENSADERLVALAQVRDLTPLRDHEGRLVALPAVEGTLAACLDAIRTVLSGRPADKRLDTNRILIYVWPPSELTGAELATVARRIVPTTAGAGLEEVVFLARQRDPETRELTDIAVRIGYDAESGIRLQVGEQPTAPIETLDDYAQRVLKARRRGLIYPYELTGMLAGTRGSFNEYDLGDAGNLVPVDRPRGQNTAALVAGVVSTPTVLHPEGVSRVVLLGDPTKSLGALSEPECARVIAALDLAERRGIPLEWFALSAGARISMGSGTENMDWVAAALKRIVTFTQSGGEINIVVAGINVGAQPYWNAEATMLMHTKGILVMTPNSAMVLTGKQSLDFSGSVSAEDNFGIGGYDRVMGPNGQAQYWAPNLAAARDVLMAHYEHTYVAPGEPGPRRAGTTDPHDRDISGYPHALAGSDFSTVGDIFSATANPDRKKAFDIRTVMRAVADQDHAVLERWAGMADAETAVVQDAHLGGRPVCLLGIESQPVPRLGFPPTDGPDTYTAGTLFPNSSKKAARAINAASGNRPLVVLANLSGFDGSPESMRKLQLEYGAEIGRAIVNFKGPIAFCVISRYHGGAFVVFSKALNPDMTVLAVEGSFASVIGGAPAAAVVFSGEVDRRTSADSRVAGLMALLAETGGAERAESAGAERAELTARLAEMRASVRAEKLADVATEFDRVHSVHRAVQVGSVDAVVSAAELRPRIIAAIEARLPLARLPLACQGERADLADDGVAAGDRDEAEVAGDLDAECAQQRDRHRETAARGAVVDLDRPGDRAAGHRQRERVHALGAALGQRPRHRAHQPVVVPGRAAHPLRVRAHRVRDQAFRRTRPRQDQRAERAREPAQGQGEQRRAAPVHAGRRHRLPGQFGDGLLDPLLKRMRRVQVVGRRPAVAGAGCQHRRVLARAVHPDPRLPFAVCDEAVRGGFVQRRGGRAAQVILGQAGRRQDPPHSLDVEVFPRVAARGERQQLVRQVEPAAEHRHGLQRLVRRAREDGGADVAILNDRVPVGGEPGGRAAMPGFYEARAHDLREHRIIRQYRIVRQYSVSRQYRVSRHETSLPGALVIVPRYPAVLCEQSCSGSPRRASPSTGRSSARFPNRAWSSWSASRTMTPPGKPRNWPPSSTACASWTARSRPPIPARRCWSSASSRCTPTWPRGAGLPGPRPLPARWRSRWSTP
jgi:acetyl-CoA carboxylase carboxyltransferase component